MKLYVIAGWRLDDSWLDRLVHSWLDWWVIHWHQTNLAKPNDQRRAPEHEMFEKKNRLYRYWARGATCFAGVTGSVHVVKAGLDLTTEHKTMIDGRWINRKPAVFDNETGSRATATPSLWRRFLAIDGVEHVLVCYCLRNMCCCLSSWSFVFFNNIVVQVKFSNKTFMGYTKKPQNDLHRSVCY